MTNKTFHAERIERALLSLLRDAAECGVVVTVETQPVPPLRMGGYVMVAHVRDGRGVQVPELWAIRFGGHIDAAPTKFAADWEAKRAGGIVVRWPGSALQHRRALEDNMRWEMVPQNEVAAAALSEGSPR